MGPIIWAFVGIAFLLFLLAAFARGGAMEVFSGVATPGRWEPGEVLSLTQRLLQSMGMSVESVVQRGSGQADVVAVDRRPVTGQRIYLRIQAEPDATPTSAADVQAASDTARGDGFNKALIVSPAGFSDEARASAAGTTVELIDGPELEELSERYRLR